MCCPSGSYVLGMLHARVVLVLLVMRACAVRDLRSSKFHFVVP